MNGAAFRELVDRAAADRSRLRIGASSSAAGTPLRYAITYKYRFCDSDCR
jgi:hypothetical protein